MLAAPGDGGRHPELAPGRYVQVSVTDTGTGMDEATRQQVFEPFFTTKGPGGGTGLGLAMIYGFMKQSGGHVEVSSAPGVGTTFRMFFPRAQSESAPGPEAAHADAPKAKGHETVLLVEDEDSVRSLACLILRSHGYTVLEARNGRQALAVIADAATGPLDLLVTDIVMPDMGGRALTAQLRDSLPHLRTLFMSGYTGEAAVLTAVQDAQVAFIQKPFTPSELARKVRAVLDQPRPGR